MVNPISGNKGLASHTPPSSPSSAVEKKESYLETAKVTAKKGLSHVGRNLPQKFKNTASTNPKDLPSQEKTEAFGISRVVQRGMRQYITKIAKVSRTHIYSSRRSSDKKISAQKTPVGATVSAKTRKKRFQ